MSKKIFRTWALVLSLLLVLQSPVTVVASAQSTEEPQRPEVVQEPRSSEEPKDSQEPQNPEEPKDSQEVQKPEVPQNPENQEETQNPQIPEEPLEPQNPDISQEPENPEEPQPEPPVEDEIPVIDNGWTCQEIPGEGGKPEELRKVYRQFENGQLTAKWVYYALDMHRELFLKEEDTEPQILTAGLYAIGTDSVSDEPFYFYLNESGIVESGWHQWEDKWLYFCSYEETDVSLEEPLRKEMTGVQKPSSEFQGLTTINETRYYLNQDGTYIRDGYVVLENHKYIFDAEGKCIKDYEIQKTGWQKDKTGWWWKDEDGSRPVTTWRNIYGKKYYFDARGYMKSGWQKISGKWYYLGSAGDGSMKTGWLQLNRKWYYLNQDGTMLTGAAQIGGKWYCFGGADDGAMKTGGWQKSDGKWYYLGNDGVGKRGWLKLGTRWFYLDGNAAMQSGWGQIYGKWYYFGGPNDGVMKSGWQKIGGKWYYLGSAGDGSMKTGWLKLNNKWYYLNGSGAMQSGWLLLGSRRYYLGGAGDGSMKSGWQKIGGKWYYLGSAGDGSMKTGWLKLSNKWYYLDGADKNLPGVMLANCKRTISGKDYWFDGSGVMRTGWISDGGWYFANNSGAKVSGWLKDKNKWYYLDGFDACRMVSNCWKTINKKQYYFYSSGAMATGKINISGNTYYFGGSNDGAMKTGWQDINGGRFYFYSDGKMAKNTTIDGQYVGADGSSGAQYTLNQIWQTNSVTTWNTDYKLSGSTKQGLENAIAGFTNSGYTVSFVLADIKTGQAVSYKACQPLYSASAIKGPYVISLLNAGNAPNSTMWNTINWSSNSDYMALRGRYGSGVFKNWLKHAGVSESQANSSYTTTTSLDMAKMWMQAYGYLNNGSSGASWAKSTYQRVLNSFISGKLCSKYTVYSKAGWIAEGGYYNVYNDAGIVMAGNSPYILAVMSSCPGTAGNSRVQNLVGQLDKVHGEMIR